jgi:hypothetical protein
MAELIVNLIAGLLELLLWMVWEAIPGLCYLTSVALVFAVTLGKVRVEFPKLSEKSYPSRRILRDGRTILSPALGTIIGFSVLGKHDRDSNNRVCACSLPLTIPHTQALNQPCASPVKE